VDEAITINITGRNEHVPAIERTIRTMKERIWAMVNQLPFKAYPHRLMNTANFRHDPETENEEGHIANDDNIVTNHGYNLRPRPTKHHDRLNLMQVTQQSTWADNAKPHMHILMTQISVKSGIKKFGKRGDDAVSKELRRLHDRKAMLPIRKDDMSSEDRHKALRYLMFIKEKRDGAVKARGCADGRPQWQYTEKGDASSPTVSLEAMMM